MINTERSCTSIMLIYSLVEDKRSYKLCDWSNFGLDVMLNLQIIDSAPRSLSFIKSTTESNKSRVVSDQPKEASRFFFSTISLETDNLYLCDQFPLVKFGNKFKQVYLFEVESTLLIEFVQTDFI